MNDEMVNVGKMEKELVGYSPYGWVGPECVRGRSNMYMDIGRSSTL